MEHLTAKPAEDLSWDLQGCSYSCVVATPDSHALYVVGSDKKLKELEEVGGTGTQVTKELDTGAVINSIALPAGAASLLKNCSFLHQSTPICSDLLQITPMYVILLLGSAWGSLEMTGI